MLFIVHLIEDIGGLSMDEFRGGKGADRVGRLLRDAAERRDRLVRLHAHLNESKQCTVLGRMRTLRPEIVLIRPSAAMH